MPGTWAWSTKISEYERPARNTATIESTPQMARSRKMAKLFRTWKLRLPTEPWRPPKRAPAKPASAAEAVKTASFVHVRLMPRVTHANWLSAMATRRRPNEERRTASTPMAAAANTAAISTVNATLSWNTTRPTCSAPPFPKTALLWVK